MEVKIKVEPVPAFHALYRPKRLKVYFGGRGGAKSWAYAEALLTLGMTRPLRILCTREFQGSILESVHHLLAATIDRLGMQNFYTVQKQTIEGLNGTNFIFSGLKNNITKVKSTEGVDIVWCEEAEAISEDSWKTLLPTIRKEGSEIWISFNPSTDLDPTWQRFVAPWWDSIEGRGFFEDENTYIRKVSWRDNPHISQTLLDQMQRDRLIMDDASFLNVWEGQTRTAIEGAIYKNEMERAKADGRICRIPIETGIPVHTFWDLGRNDTTAIWFMQEVGKELRFIDFYEHRLVSITHYAQVLREKGYYYGEHYLPHDARVTDLSANRSRAEILEDMGVKPLSIVPRVSDIQEGIEAVRVMFARCWFDKDRCADGIKALASYQYTFDEQHKTYRLKPQHNWASNGADAFRQCAQGYMPPAPVIEVDRGQPAGYGWMM